LQDALLFRVRVGKLGKKRNIPEIPAIFLADKEEAVQIFTGIFPWLKLISLELNDSRETSKPNG